MAACYRFLVSSYYSRIMMCPKTKFAHTFSFHYHSAFTKTFKYLQIIAPAGHTYNVKNHLLQAQSEYLGQLLKCHYVSDNEKDNQKSPKKRSSSEKDFMTMLYDTGGGRKDGKFRAASKDEYFKQVWMRETRKKYQALYKEDDVDESDETTSGQGEFSKPLPENTFGTLDASQPPHGNHNERLEETFNRDDNDRDWRKNIPLTKYGRRNKTAYTYHKEMLRLAKEGKIKEVIAVLDKSMMIQDRVRPNKYTFIILISILGRIGYTRKAFQLFRQMKHMGLDPPDKVYTSLFNSCANCPMPDYGLNRANTLYHHMKDIGITPALQTVKASMKAFAMCGDFAKAFQILDETNLPLDAECFNALMMACITDREAGFKRALQVWMLMRDHNIQPDESTYNLLARSVRDCGIGNLQNFASDLGLNSGKHECVSESEMLSFKEGANIFLDSPEMHGTQIQFLPLDNSEHYFNQNYTDLSEMDSLNQINMTDIKNSINPYQTPSENREEWGLKEKKELTEDKAKSVTVASEKITFIPADHCNSNSEQYRLTDESLQSSISSDRFVNVKQGSHELDKSENISYTLSPKSQPVVRLSDLKTRPGRLSLIGGPESFISHMLNSGVHPDMKTFTLILSSLPNNEESEFSLLKLMEDVGVTPDIDCLNDVMMRRNMRHQSDTVKDILPMISKLRLTPNMRTYAALALTCHKEKDGISLINDMKDANLEPTVEVIGHLIYISRMDYKYKLRLLTVLEDLNIKPNEHIIKIIEKCIAKTKQKIALAEEQRKTSDMYLSPWFQNNLRKFLRFYRPWLLRTELNKPPHPWEGLEDTDRNKDKE